VLKKEKKQKFCEVINVFVVILMNYFELLMVVTENGNSRISYFPA